jgi:hypothetical protein
LKKTKGIQKEEKEENSGMRISRKKERCEIGE